MSLLIKALQKAEQSKEGASADKTSVASTLELELTPHHEHDISSLAEESGFDHTVPLSKPAVTSPPAAPAISVEEPSPQPAAPSVQSHSNISHVAGREAAANVFQAKTDANDDPGSRRAMWMGLAGLFLLLMVGGGFYYYLQTLQTPDVVVMRPPVPRPVEPVVTNPPAPAEVQQQAPAVADAGQTTPASPVTATQQEEVKAEKQPAAEPEKNLAKVAPVTPPANIPESKKPTLPADDKGVKVTRNRKAEPALNATAVSAYQAFMAGDDAVAGRLYRQLLQTDQRSMDALLGLAAVASRQENNDEAVSLYGRALEIDPRNSVAQAGLIALVGHADPLAAESRIKSLLAQQPEAAYLHAALGGIYADQGQWPNSQQSYFQAFRLDPSSAENAFNLAVSLDQMGKQDLALDYYQRARDLLPNQGGSVDRAGLESRISQLRTALGK